MTANMVLLEKITVGAAGASSVTFSGIPQTGYTDLVLKASCRSDQSNVARSWKVQPNGVDITARNLDAENNPFVAFSGTSRNMNTNGTGSTANSFNNYNIYIPNYASTTTYKSLSVDGAVENNGTDANLKLFAGLYSSNTAISSITCIINAGSFVQHSTFSLYGVADVNTTPVTAPFATGGNIVANDGTYWYHAFLTSGTFTPAKAITCDYLVVAGGGGGGKGLNAGAGGAGGLRSTVTATGGGGALESALSLTAQAYSVTVGAGGAGGVSNGNNGIVGSNSILSTITSTGGGYGGGPNYGAGYNNGGPGGSGGGGGLYNTLGGAASPAGQGYAGGASVQDAGGVQAGGGGGAGAVGTTGLGTGPVLGTGGAGLQLTAFSTATNTGASGYYAGGGGGGANAGLASGGAGGGGAAGVAGTANTGGGGGGAGNSGGNTSGAGGSGIVIIRYAMA
jgi:hypothetical protein